VRSNPSALAAVVSEEEKIPLAQWYSHPPRERKTWVQISVVNKVFRERFEMLSV
jgi:hypothetical protein